MKYAVVCSHEEWNSYKEQICNFINISTDAQMELYFSDADEKKSGFECGKQLSQLLSGNVNSIIFVCTYNENAAALVFKTGIKEIAIPFENDTFVFSPNDKLLEKREQELLKAKEYAALKMINRIRTLLHYFHRDTILSSYPTSMQIESTSYCNAECIMCGHFIYKNAIGKHIPRKLTENLEPYLIYADTIILHGNGEPFLQPDITEIISYYGSFGVKMVTNTNLSILSDNILDCIKKYFIEITVSIDGCTKDIYEKIRLNLSFDRLISNINRLNEAAPDLPKKIAVVVSRQNLHQIADFVPFAKEHGFSSINYISMGSSEICGNQHDEPGNYVWNVSEQLHKALQLADEYGIHIDFPQQLLRQERSSKEVLESEQRKINEFCMFPKKEYGDMLFEKYVRPKIEHLKSKCDGEINYSDYMSQRLCSESVQECSGIKCSGLCDSLLFRPYIMLEGKVSTCCLRPKFFLGEISSEKSLGEIWNCEEMQLLRKRYYEGEMPSYCCGCSFIENGFLKLVSFEKKYGCDRK